MEAFGRPLFHSVPIHNCVPNVSTLFYIAVSLTVRLPDLTPPLLVYSSAVASAESRPGNGALTCI